jgi:Flp pilus assembly protein TadG
MSALNSFLRKFRRDQRGSIIIESYIFLPVMIFSFVAFSISWDSLRAVNLAQKATFTVADIVSRETRQITTSFMINYIRVLGYTAEIPNQITPANMASAPVALRITSVNFTEGATAGAPGTFTVAWSMTSSAARLPALTNQTLQAITAKIPSLLNGDNILVVESQLTWTPILSASEAAELTPNDPTEAWFGTKTIETITTVRPRFVPRLCANFGTMPACDL